MFDTPKKLNDTYRVTNQPMINSNKLHNTNRLKQQLMREMLELDQQRQQLQTGADSIDLTMRNSYRTMIMHRHSLLTQISRQLS